MRKDINGSIVILLVSLFFLYQTTQIPTLNVNDGLGAAFYPRVILILIIILSIVSMIITYFKNKNIKAEKIKDIFSWKVLLLFVAFAIYVFFIDVLGFVVSSTLFMMFTYLLLVEAKKSWKTNIIIFVCLFLSALALSFIFENYLNVFLPSGSLF